jgi:hypothetical protein
MKNKEERLSGCQEEAREGNRHAGISLLLPIPRHNKNPILFCIFDSTN